MEKKNVIIASIVGVIVLFILVGIIWYKSGTKAVDKNKSEEKIIVIEEGTRTEGILNLLKEQKVIKNRLVAAIYIKLHGISTLQAGKYQVNINMPLGEVLHKISSGEVYDERVKITFLEGKNIRWIAKTIAEKTNNTEDDVYKLLQDKEYINSLIHDYWFLTDTVTNENIYYPLEGYLYPDTYIFENADVSLKTIFNIILNQTNKVLSKYKEQIEKSGGSVHQVLTMASIVELEGNDSESRAGIAGVLFNRLKEKMSLGSDVTTYYSAKVDMGERNLTVNEINTNNPYNTRGPNMAGKLPIGPVSNPSEDSIKAVLNYSKTDNLYFVADKNGKIYFTKTYEEHQKIIESLQKQGLWYEYN